MASFNIIRPADVVSDLKSKLPDADDFAKGKVELDGIEPGTTWEAGTVLKVPDPKNGKLVKFRLTAPVAVFTWRQVKSGKSDETDES